MSGSLHLVVGGVYRFRGEGYFAEYGEWTATRIDSGMVYGVSKGSYRSGQETAMCYNPNINHGANSDVLEVSAAPDETEAFFV